MGGSLDKQPESWVGLEDQLTPQVGLAAGAFVIVGATVRWLVRLGVEETTLASGSVCVIMVPVWKASILIISTGMSVPCATE